MKFDFTKVTRLACRTGLKLRKHAPEIMTGAGVVGVVASGIMACKSTIKAIDILDECKDTVEKIHYCEENMSEQYDEKDMKKDLATTYIQTAGKLVKTYAPAVILGTISIGCIVGSTVILKKRNIGLAIAYASADKMFKDYRARVVERFGEDVDYELYYNIKPKETEVTVTDKRGREKTLKKTIDEIDEETRHNEFTRCFTTGTPGWEKDPEHNKLYLLRQERYLNDLLESRGHLFVNEVYDALGYPRTKVGNQFGWVAEKGKISFGIFDGTNKMKEKAEFINGHERSIWIDLNVQGYILDLI